MFLDTFSGAVHASCHMGEASCDVCHHFLQAFAALRVPQQVKTDNGPAYMSQKLHSSLQQWSVSHITHIPLSPTGQAIVECTHSTLKTLLLQQKEGMLWEIPQNCLAKALYVYTFLNFYGDNPMSPILKHITTLKDGLEVTQKAQVLIKDPETGQIRCPYALITWRRGYICVPAEGGPRWLPARLVKPYDPGPAQAAPKAPGV